MAASGTLTIVRCVGCVGAEEAFAPTSRGPKKPAGARLAIDESTRLAMSLAERRECEAKMRTWYSRPDPADFYDGDV